MLRVTLLGHLGADPEQRPSQNGHLLSTFRVAVNQIQTAADGQREESTEWFRVRVSGRLAEFARQLTRGTRVLVVGRLAITRYQARDGEQRVNFDVWADDIRGLSARSTVRQEAAGDAPADEDPPADANPARRGRGRVARAERPDDLSGGRGPSQPSRLYSR